MTQPEMPPAALPHAHFLSYVANVSTPTRVRLIASRVTLVVGLVHALVAILVLAKFGSDVYDTAKEFAGGMWWMGPAGPMPPVMRPRGAGITFADVWLAFKMNVREEWPLTSTIPVLAAVGTLLPLIAPAIKRGNGGASMLAFFYFALAIVPVLFMTVMVFCVPIVTAGLVGPGSGKDFAMLWWLLLVPGGILMTLLMKDVCAFLLWIIRNPVTEKPPVAFLPTAHPGTGNP